MRLMGQEDFPEGEFRTPDGQSIPFEVSYQHVPELSVGDWLMYRYGQERNRRLLVQVVEFGDINPDDDGDPDFTHVGPYVNLALETGEGSGIFRRFKRRHPMPFDPEYRVEALHIFFWTPLVQQNEGEDFIVWDDELVIKVSTKLYEEPYWVFRHEVATELLQRCLIDEPPGAIEVV